MKSPYLAGFALRFSSWIEAGRDAGDTGGGKRDEREGRGAGRAVMPPWPRQGNDAVSSTEP